MLFEDHLLHVSDDTNVVFNGNYSDVKIVFNEFFIEVSWKNLNFSAKNFPCSGVTPLILISLGGQYNSGIERGILGLIFSLIDLIFRIFFSFLWNETV